MGGLIIYCPFQLVVHVTGGFLEFLDSLTHAFGQLGQFLGTEKNQDYRQNQKDFGHPG